MSDLTALLYLSRLAKIVGHTPRACRPQVGASEGTPGDVSPLRGHALHCTSTHADESAGSDE